jgi:peroxiredoxin (alkyl hydroperoxide reductase subunit C)
VPATTIQQPIRKERKHAFRWRKFPDSSSRPWSRPTSTRPSTEIDNDTYAGKWLCVFFYPKDFTFVCPTELAGFASANQAFLDRDCQLLTGSTDSEFVHHAWRTHHKDLNALPFPMLADVKRELTTALGILDKEEGVAQRATFLVDPNGVIRFVYVTDLSVGRNPQEVLRVLDALQTDELCPCNWKQGEDTLKAA